MTAAAPLSPASLTMCRLWPSSFHIGGEDLLLDRRWLQLDPGQDGRVEHVHAGVDFVAHELLRLLDEALDAAVIRVQHDAVLGRFLDTRHHDRALAPVPPMELLQLFERKVTDDVGVEHEERFGAFGEDGFGQRQRARRAERFRLVRKDQLDAEPLDLGRQFRFHLFRPVRHGQYDLRYARLDQRLDLVQQDRLVGKLDQLVR